jgi:BirA family transcriptional regulator, biotin operon repressor / biotin---[acetyl-CoA-carboxylase] ligase
LIESLKPGLVALGMGINVSHAPEGLAYRASFLAAHGCVETPLRIQARLDQALRHWLGVWNSGAGFADIRGAWMAACSHMGKPVSVNLPEGRVEGVFSGLAEDGAMLLKVGGATRVIRAGDVAAL